jgi:hypothetical protein
LWQLSEIKTYTPGDIVFKNKKFVVMALLAFTSIVAGSAMAGIGGEGPGEIKSKYQVCMESCKAEGYNFHYCNGKDVCGSYSTPAF